MSNYLNLYTGKRAGCSHPVLDLITVLASVIGIAAATVYTALFILF